MFNQKLANKCVTSWPCSCLFSCLCVLSPREPCSSVFLPPLFFFHHVCLICSSALSPGVHCFLFVYIVFLWHFVFVGLCTNPCCLTLPRLLLVFVAIAFVYSLFVSVFIPPCLFFCLSLLFSSFECFSFVYIPSQNVDEVCCAVGWKYFSGKCYFFSGDKKTWTASRDECLAAGGDLVIISSLEELDFLKRSKPGSGREHYWIGLSDAVKEGDWRWLDGTKLNITPRYWQGTEPDNWKGENNEYTGGENCSDMEISSRRFSLWDGFCDVQSAIHKRVCEAKVSK
uniref:C-type lectin domain-containing protein n=1 Tax=Astyanax mexicanus TaxID=7994 RepID=A0A8B9GZT0_ASTMX